MKLIINTLFVLVLLSNLAFAGNIYPVDFTQQEEKTYDLAVKEGVEFLPFKGILIVERFKEDNGVDMKLVLDDGKVWGLLPLSILSSVNVDVDRDNDNDLSILLRDVENGKATISFREVRDDVRQTNPIVETTLSDTAKKNADTAGDITGQAVKETGGSSLTIGILIVLGILIAGLLVYFFFIRKKDTTSF